MLKRIFVAHPASVGESYGQHFCHALGFSVAMFAGAIACLLHAFIPAMYTQTGSRIVIRLHDKMTVNRVSR
ncbi:DUF6356 family protein [Sphingopyxis sp. R3-92]|uniref:DUF6356 family protein n=1 Tax=Sphingopyxis sp. R3-92 TaxID=3158553 RepID=UPI003EE4DF63